jgi:hypothetical protein
MTRRYGATRNVPYADVDAKTDLLALKKPLCYWPPHISSRMSAQGSVLMVCPKPTVEVALPFVKKIIIKRTAQFGLKKANQLLRHKLATPLCGSCWA